MCRVLLLSLVSFLPHVVGQPCYQFDLLYPEAPPFSQSQEARAPNGFMIELLEQIAITLPPPFQVCGVSYLASTRSFLNVYDVLVSLEGMEPQRNDTVVRIPIAAGPIADCQATPQACDAFRGNLQMSSRVIQSQLGTLMPSTPPPIDNFVRGFFETVGVGILYVLTILLVGANVLYVTLHVASLFSLKRWDGHKHLPEKVFDAKRPTKSIRKGYFVGGLKDSFWCCLNVTASGTVDRLPKSSLSRLIGVMLFVLSLSVVALFTSTMVSAVKLTSPVPVVSDSLVNLAVACWDHGLGSCDYVDQHKGIPVRFNSPHDELLAVFMNQSVQGAVYDLSGLIAMDNLKTFRKNYFPLWEDATVHPLDGTERQYKYAFHGTDDGFLEAFNNSLSKVRSSVMYNQLRHRWLPNQSAREAAEATRPVNKDFFSIAYNTDNHRRIALYTIISFGIAYLVGWVSSTVVTFTSHYDPKAGDVCHQFFSFLVHVPKHKGELGDPHIPAPEKTGYVPLGNIEGDIAMRDDICDVQKSIQQIEEKIEVLPGMSEQNTTMLENIEDRLQRLEPSLSFQGTPPPDVQYDRLARMESRMEALETKVGELLDAITNLSANMSPTSS